LIAQQFAKKFPIKLSVATVNKFGEKIRVYQQLNREFVPMWKATVPDLRIPFQRGTDNRGNTVQIAKQKSSIRLETHL